MKNLLGVAFLIVTVTACSTAQKEPETWSDGMREFAKLLAQSMPLVHKTELLTMPERQELIDLTKKMSELSKSVSHQSAPMSKDTGFQKNAQQLEESLNEIYVEMKDGKDRSAQRRFAAVTSYCISCHTLREGIETKDLEWNSFARALNHREKAEFYAATRQFESAIMQYEYALTDKDFAARDPKGWNESAIKLLAIIVRAKNDPNLSLEIVSRFFDAGSYPKTLAPVARVWRQEILRWQDQEKKSPTGINAQAAEDLRADIRRFKNPAESLIQDLRLSRILHFLKASGKPQTATYQQWHLYSGEVVERLIDLNIWDEPSDHFALCVRSRPGSATAKTCLTRYRSVQAKQFGGRDPKAWPASARAEWKSLEKLAR